MAQEFAGKRVLVTLKFPAGRIVEGIVAQVLTEAANPQLVLHNALFRDSGHRFPVFRVTGNDIADLRFLESPSTPNPPQAATSQTIQPPRASQPPVDPAIVSFGKPRPTSQIYVGPTVEIVSQLPTSPASEPTPPEARQWKGKESKVEDAARLKGPFSALDNLQNKGVTADDHAKEAKEEAPTIPKGPRNQRNAPTQPQPPFQILRRDSKTKLGTRQGKNSRDLPVLRQNETLDTTVEIKAVETAIETATTLRHQASKKSRKSLSIDSQVNEEEPVQPTFRGKGWRQSPMLKEANAANELDKSPSKSRKKKNQKNRRSRADELTGWATEEATDIQEMGDFDFEGSLAKFDKRSVFEQLRREDAVPEGDRLVSHNKLKAAHRPGTFGGKKLHPTENVLDVPKTQPSALKPSSRRGSARLKLSSDSSGHEERGLRTSSRLSDRDRRKPLGKSSTTTSLKKVERSNTDPAPVVRVNSNRSALRPSNPTSSTSNGHFPRLTPSESEGLAQEQQSPAVDGVQFYLDKTRAICPVITPGGITALEDLAVSEHKLKLQTMNENAGRSLAEIIINVLSDDKAEHSSSPTAIFLVGNHRAGARALAAARHLCNRGFSPVCCVLGLDRPGHVLDAEVEKELSMIRRIPGAVVANWREVQKYLMVNEEQEQFADAWVDALLAPGHSYDTLVPEDQNAVREMVTWANKKPAALGQRLVFSVDVPCGINASTGEMIITESSSRIQMRSSYIVCMGAPRTGLLTALRNACTSWSSDSATGHAHSQDAEALLDVTVFVVDIGINEVWKAYGQELELATGSGVDFGMKWFLTLALDQHEDNVEWATE